MGRRDAIFVAPTLPHTRRAGRRYKDHRCRSSSRLRSYSRTRHRRSCSCEESDSYDSGYEDPSCERIQHEGRSRTTRRVYRPLVQTDYRDPKVYYPTTLRALRDRENARIDGMCRRHTVVSAHRDIGSDPLPAICNSGEPDASFDEMHRRFDRMSITRCTRVEDPSWKDDDCPCSHSYGSRHDHEREHRLRYRDDGGCRHGSGNARGSRSRSRSRTRIVRHSCKTVEDPCWSKFPARVTEHRSCDGIADAVMSGARDPRDAVAGREWRRAALLQDDGGVWHEYGDSDECNVVRAVSCYDELDERYEGVEHETWECNGRWHNRAQPVGFVEELDWQ